MFPSISVVKRTLKKRLNKKRYEHSVAVAEKARKMAQLHQFPTDYFELAGLLHDCGRIIPAKDMAQFAHDHRLEIDPKIEQLAPALYHCEVGRFIAKHEFNIDHPDIDESIRFHATGYPGMGLVAQVIFIADLIEPTRTYDGLNRIREAVKVDLQQALLLSCRWKIKYLLKNNLPIHHWAFDYWNFLCGRESLTPRY